MTDSTALFGNIPTATICLPVHILQNLRVRAFASAALVTVELARAEHFNRSPEGRAHMNALPCGHQDALLAELNTAREWIDEHLATVEACEQAIRASGHHPIESRPTSHRHAVLWSAEIVLDRASGILQSENPISNRWEDHVRTLRSFLTNTRYA